MAKTQVADVIVPTEFEKYVIARTAELSTFGQSGIIEHSAAFDELASMGGRTVEMPFWKDLTAARQLLNELFRRWDNNLCSFAQAKTLRKRGLPTNVTRDEAKRMIDEIAVKENWRPRA